MGKDESKKNEMSVNATEFIPKLSNEQGLGSFNQPPTTNVGTLPYGTIYTQFPYNSYVNPPEPHNTPRNSPTRYDERDSNPHRKTLPANEEKIQRGNRQSQQPVNKQQLPSTPQNSSGSRGKQGLGSSSQALTINEERSQDGNQHLQQSVNQQQPYNHRGNFSTRHGKQGLGSFSQALTINEEKIQRGNRQSQQPVNKQQLPSTPQDFPASPNWQNSYSYVQAPAANEEGSQSGDQQSQQPVNPPQLYNIPQNSPASRGKRGSNPHRKGNFHASRGKRGLGLSSQALTTNEGRSQDGNQQSQETYTAKPIRFMIGDSFLNQELKNYLQKDKVPDHLFELFPYYEETEEFIRDFNPGEEFVYKNNDGPSETLTLSAEKQKLWNDAKKKYLAQVNKLQEYSTQWQKLGDNQTKKEKTKDILKDFISKYDTSDAVQMSLCFAIYNEGFKEYVNKILESDEIEPKKKDYGEERIEEYKRQKDKYEAFKKAYDEKLKAQNKLKEQKDFATFTEDELKVTVENDKLSFSDEAEEIINRIVEQGKCDNISTALKAQELFYFAHCIFDEQKNSLETEEINNFGIFFNKYTKQINKMKNYQYQRELGNFKKNPTNYGNKVKAEIIYTVLNGLANALPYRDIINQIWNGVFLSNYHSEAPEATRNSLRLNLIESILTEKLAIYKTQKLQSALYDYLTPANSGITQDELDMRKKLLTEVNTREKLEEFKKNTLAFKLQKQKEKLKKESKINTDTLEGIFILAVNNGINIPLERNDGLDSLILNYIDKVNLTKENNVKTLSNIIYTVLYPSVTYMSSKQNNNDIIKALKTKLNDIKKEICKKGIECESYLSYTVITIDKFIDCYESKKSKKQSSENTNPTIDSGLSTRSRKPEEEIEKHVISDVTNHSDNTPREQNSTQDTQKDEENSESSKNLDPTINSDLSKGFYESEAETEKRVTSDVINSSENIPQPQESPQDTQKDEENSELSKNPDPTIDSGLSMGFYKTEAETEKHVTSDAINSSGNIPQPQESPQDTQTNEESSESSKSAKPAEQEKISDSEFSENLIYKIKVAINDDHAVDNKVKAIITLIKYYASEQQLAALRKDLANQRQQSAANYKKKQITYLINELNDESENPRDQKTSAGSQSKDTTRYNTNSDFEYFIEDAIISKIRKENNEESVDDLLEIKPQHKIADREVDFHITFKKDCSIEIAENFKIPIAKGTEIVIEADGAPHFEKDILPKNLKEAQDAITGKTIGRNYEIKGTLIDNKDLYTSLKEKVSTLRDKEDQLLNLACYLQKFKQRRKHLDPTIDGESSKKFYQTEATQDTKKAEQNSGLLEITPELKELQNILQDKDVKEVISESIKKSKLFFSIPLLTSCIKDGQYQKEEIQKVFLNCFINAYCSQALSNLKEFYRQKAEEEKKELENTKTTQPSQQEQNGDQTTQEGKNGMLASLKGVGNCQTNRGTGGISALTQISDARGEEKTAIKQHFLKLKNTRTSEQGNVL